MADGARGDRRRGSAAHPEALSRREALQLVGAALTGLLVGGGSVETPTPEPTAIALSTVSRPPVAIAQATDYDLALLRQRLGDLLDGLGGLADVISAGDRVAIKVNLTSGMYFQPPAGVSAVESYVTHPAVVRVLGELLRDAGARQLYLVEAVYDQESYPAWGYVEVAEALDATLIDLNTPAPYRDFVPRPVGEDGSVYEAFLLHPLLGEVDALISVAKLKCHYHAGVTLSMKNLVGLLPVGPYRLEAGEWWRSALHGPDYGRRRLPRAIVDLNRACPISLAVIDGIKAAEGGEVPRGSFAPVEPGVLLAGKNALATDAVAAAVMGFDPTADYPAAPFLRGDNHLNLAYESGLGTNRLAEIEVRGASIAEVRVKFAPATAMS